MALHEVQLKGYSVRPGSLSLGTFGSYGIEQLHVTLDDTWSGLAVTATFNPPKGEPREIRLPENGLIDVPAEATANEGTGTIVYCGVANGVQRITKTQGYNVITRGPVGGTEPFKPSESLATQVLQAALNAENNSAEAKSVADNLRNDAANGKFNGKDGAKGDKGDDGEKGDTGADGVSPTVRTAQTDTGATITITDAAGTHTVALTNGPKGEAGVVTATAPLTYDADTQTVALSLGDNLSVANGTLNAKDTTYTNATVSTNGLMSATDKLRANLVWSMVDTSTGKLREVAIPAATDSTLGGVKVGNGLAIDSNGVLTINDEITVTTQNANLLDKSDTANQVSKNIFYVRSSSSSFVAANGDTAIYFPVGKWGAGNYKFPIDYSQYGGSTAYNIALFNADKTYIKTKTSVAVDTTDSTAYILSLNITQAEIDSGAYYIGLSIRTVQIGTSAMVVKDVDYPATYIEYGTTTSTHKTQKLENVLADKKAVFCGDSICAGKSVSASSDRYGYGWAGVIGVANNMKWQNLGVDGATVAEVFGQSGIVVNQLANAYSDADYIILEGGCNDYDKLSGATTADTMGEVSTSWDDSFKVTTFAGALEHLFYTALSNHPNAKVGYIIPQKMGKRTWTAYESGSYRIYYNLAIEICKKWGVPYLDLWYESSLNPNLSVYYNSSLSKDEANADGSVCYVDGQHLTEAGYDLIVPRIESWMRTL